jgi:hypothetical protein
VTRPGFTRWWRVVTVTPPAAGADWFMTAPGNAAWRVISLTARLVTAAVAGNRRVTLRADRAGQVWWAQPAGADQIITQTTDYAAYAGAQPGGFTPGTLTLPLPSLGLLLRPGYRLAATTTGIDPGDQWSAIFALVDEIPSDDPYVGDMGSTSRLTT